MRLTLFPHSSIVGIEITSTALYLVQLKKVKQHFLVEQSVIEDLPNAIWEQERITQWHKLSALLASTVANLNMQKKYAVTHLPSQLVRVGTLTLPEGLNANEIENEIYANALHGWRELRENTVIQYMPCEALDGYHKIQYVCADKNDITQYFNGIRTAGLFIKIIEVDIYALQRFVYACLPVDFSKKPFHIIVCISTKLITTLLIEREHILFHRKCLFQTHLECCLRFKQILKEFSIHFHNITLRQIILIGNETCIHTMVNDPELAEREFVQPNSLSPFIFKSAQCTTSFSAKIDCLTMALGAAMRDVSGW